MVTIPEFHVQLETTFLNNVFHRENIVLEFMPSFGYDKHMFVELHNITNHLHDGFFSKKRQ